MKGEVVTYLRILPHVNCLAEYISTIQHGKVYFVLRTAQFGPSILSRSSLLRMDHSKSPTSKSALQAVFRGSGTVG